MEGVILMVDMHLFLTVNLFLDLLIQPFFNDLLLYSGKVLEWSFWEMGEGFFKGKRKHGLEGYYRILKIIDNHLPDPLEAPSPGLPCLVGL